MKYIFILFLVLFESFSYAKMMEFQCTHDFDYEEDGVEVAFASIKIVQDPPFNKSKLQYVLYNQPENAPLDFQAAGEGILLKSHPSNPKNKEYYAVNKTIGTVYTLAQLTWNEDKSGAIFLLEYGIPQNVEHYYSMTFTCKAL